jgi:sodium-dependent phosphate cotransporter
MPYIMGANITTLGDTLLVALLLENQVAVHVVLAELFTITLITLLLLGLLYRPLQERITQITDWILDERRRLAGFVAILFITPILLILVP